LEIKISNDDRDFEMTDTLIKGVRMKNRGIFKNLFPGCAGRIYFPIKM